MIVSIAFCRFAGTQAFNNAMKREAVLMKNKWLLPLVVALVILIVAVLMFVFKKNSDHIYSNAYLVMGSVFNVQGT
jgi:cobalamin synthase